MKKLISAILPIFCLVNLTACSTPNKSNIPGLSYTLDLSSDECFSDIENMRSDKEYTVTDVEGENVLFYVEPEPIHTVPPGVTPFPCLWIGSADWKGYSASFEFKTRATFALYAESCKYTVDGDSEEEKKTCWYYYEIGSDGSISFETVCGCELNSSPLKNDSGEEVKLKDYDPDVWNKVTLKNENNKLVITVNDQRIETEVRFDGTEHGRLALDGSMLKNIVME